MTLQEARDFKVELLDMVHEQASDPIPDIEAIRAKVEEFFLKLEASINGKET